MICFVYNVMHHNAISLHCLCQQLLEESLEVFGTELLQQAHIPYPVEGTHLPCREEREGGHHLLACHPMQAFVTMSWVLLVTKPGRVFPLCCKTATVTKPWLVCGPGEILTGWDVLCEGTCLTCSFTMQKSSQVSSEWKLVSSVPQQIMQVVASSLATPSSAHARTAWWSEWPTSPSWWQVTVPSPKLVMT